LNNFIIHNTKVGGRFNAAYSLLKSRFNGVI
jgi:hypothetical protein